MIAIDASGFLLGALLLVAVRFVPQLVSPLAFWLLLSTLAAAFGADLLGWFLQGVRAIELDGNTLILRRGRRRSLQRIERASVRRVVSRRRWGGQTLEIRLRQLTARSGTRTVKGVLASLRERLMWRFTRRDRVLLRDDAFDRRGFADLAGRLAAWEG
jgi:hypothetical protein